MGGFASGEKAVCMSPEDHGAAVWEWPTAHQTGAEDLDADVEPLWTQTVDVDPIVLQGVELFLRTGALPVAR